MVTNELWDAWGPLASTSMKFTQFILQTQTDKVVSSLLVLGLLEGLLEFVERVNLEL